MIRWTEGVLIEQCVGSTRVCFENERQRAGGDGALKEMSQDEAGVAGKEWKSCGGGAG